MLSPPPVPDWVGACSAALMRAMYHIPNAITAMARIARSAVITPDVPVSVVICVSAIIVFFFFRIF